MTTMRGYKAYDVLNNNNLGLIEEEDPLVYANRDSEMLPIPSDEPVFKYKTEND